MNTPMQPGMKRLIPLLAGLFGLRVLFGL